MLEQQDGDEQRSDAARNQQASIDEGTGGRSGKYGGDYGAAGARFGVILEGNRAVTIFCAGVGAACI